MATKSNQENTSANTSKVEATGPVIEQRQEQAVKSNVTEVAHTSLLAAKELQAAGRCKLLVLTRLAEGLCKVNDTRDNGEFIDRTRGTIKLDYSVAMLYNLMKFKAMEDGEIYSIAVNWESSTNNPVVQAVMDAWPEYKKEAIQYYNEKQAEFYSLLEQGKYSEIETLLLSFGVNMDEMAKKHGITQEAAADVTKKIIGEIEEPKSLLGKTNEILTPAICAAIGSIGGVAFNVYRKGHIDTNTLIAGAASTAASYFGVGYLASEVDMIKTMNPWLLKAASFGVGAGLAMGTAMVADMVFSDKATADVPAISAPAAEAASFF